VRTVECERESRTVDAAGREPLLRGGVGGQQPESTHEWCERFWRRRFLRAAENDFEGTRTTIPRVRDSTGQVDDGGALVRVHAGRGQDTCISEQYGGHTRGQSCGIAGLGGVRGRRQGERA
jgi:hypothetical protein